MNATGPVNQSSHPTVPNTDTNGSMTSTASSNASKRMLATADPAPSASANPAKHDQHVEFCVICHEDVDLAARDVEVTPCQHTYHRTCLDQWISYRHSQNKPARNPHMQCVTCRQAVPVSTPVWDNKNQAFVCRISKRELQSPFPYVGAPMTFPLPSGMGNSEVTVALAFKGIPWLTAQLTPTPLPSPGDGRSMYSLPVILSDDIVDLPFTSVPEEKVITKQQLKLTLSNFFDRMSFINQLIDLIKQYDYQ